MVGVASLKTAAAFQSETALVNIAALAPFPLKSLLTEIRRFLSAGIVP